MKTIQTYLFTLIALFTIQVAQAQCTGTVTVSGTDPTFTFTNTNTGVTTWYNWNFGDGTTASSASSGTTNHTYTANGTYTVIGSFYDTSTATACSDVDTVYVTVSSITNPTCNAAFSIGGNGPNFVFTPSNVPNSPLGYYNFEWNWGDGSATQYSFDMSGVTHTYTTNGTYNVTCILYDSIFCSDTVVSSLTVTNAGGTTCNAAFMAIDSSGTHYFIPTANTTASTTYSWDFGDGTTSNLQYPTHVYSPTGTGTFTACLVVNDTASNCADTSCITITINGGSSCNAMFTDSINYLTAVFTPSYTTGVTTYLWDFGDGTVSTVQNPVHVYPWVAGTTTYNVCLTVTGQNGCTDTVCNVITLYNPVSSNYISGSVYTNSFADSGVVFLIQYDSILGTLTAVDTTIIDSSGTYSFGIVPNGSYLIKAALSPNSAYYSSFLPTYYAIGTPQIPGGELLWSNADYATSPNNGIYYDILMVPGTNLGGNGFVGGLVSQGANKVGDPISDILIIVTDLSGNPVAYEYSDISGSFDMDDLPYGDYILYPEVYGKTTNSMNFTLSATSPNANNFRVAVNSSSVDVSIATGIERVNEFSNVTLFPNPVQNELNIDFGRMIQNEINIEMYDVAGRRISNQEFSGSNTVKLNTTSLNEGVYLIKLTSNEGEQVYKFVK